MHSTVPPLGRWPSAPRVVAFGVLALAAGSLAGCAVSSAERPGNAAASLERYAVHRSPHPGGHELESGRRAPAEVASDDLWQRLSSSFAIGDNQHSEVDRELERWMRWPRTLSEASARAEPFLHYVVEEIERRGLPGELALVPFVETGFRLTARSHRDATGLWQIMPATGERFGLAQSWWYDGRQDFIASTHAAMDYLSFLYRRFKGDPLLTLAAYNAGEGRVDAARARNRSAGRGEDFWSLSLPTETESYVPRILALARIVGDPARYGVTLTPIPNRPLLATVATGGQIELAVAAELAELPAEDLRQLNPGHLRWATAPDGPHLLVVPEDKARVLQAGLASLPASQRVRWRAHRVSGGDTLYGLSRRYGVTPAVLRHANGLGSDRIRVGQTLRLPMAGTTALAESARAARPGRSRKLYVVRPGDNLWSIGRRFGVSHRQIARWNDLRPQAVIRPGKRLVIWA